MALRKCCVGNCPSTNRTHRLFYLPKDDNLRRLWLSFLVPTNIHLSGLTKEQLVEKQVCQNHFDRSQFDSIGNRLRGGYPSLFTDKEISHGIPLSSTVGNHLSDHNYASNAQTDEATTAEDEVGDLNDHNYFIANVSERSHNITTPLVTEIALPMETAVDQQVQLPTSSAKPDAGINKQKPTGSSRNELDQETEQSYVIKKIRKRAFSVNKKSFNARLTSARRLCQDQTLFDKFDQLNKQVQNFIMMQLKSANKKKKAVRFTDDEKLLALTLMKESPKGYRLLQKIFKLPTKRTLNRLAEKITFDVGINENIFKLIEKKSQHWDINKKLCSIAFDEVALTPHLTYVESKDDIKGFKALGKEKEKKLCDHALVFMLRGICVNWKQPICYYFCEGTTSTPDIIRILKEVVQKVSQAGLIPLALVCDQGATFRSAMKILKQETEKKSSR